MRGKWEAGGGESTARTFQDGYNNILWATVRFVKELALALAPDSHSQRRRKLHQRQTNWQRRRLQAANDAETSTGRLQES